MPIDSSGSENSEGGDGCGAKSASDPVQVLLELALESDSHSAARIGPVAREMMRRLDPRDSAEMMLVTQMIATFSRAMFLSRHANKQKHPKWFVLYSGECDRTMNLYRKQMAALADYRRPRRRTFTAIRTANIAGQQVVVGGSARGGSAAAGGVKRKEARAKSVESISETEKTLPAVGQREGGASRGDPQDEAVGA
jgi:hypothetical protein